MLRDQGVRAAPHSGHTPALSPLRSYPQARHAPGARRGWRRSHHPTPSAAKAAPATHGTDHHPEYHNRSPALSTNAHGYQVSPPAAPFWIERGKSYRPGKFRPSASAIIARHAA